MLRADGTKACVGYGVDRLTVGLVAICRVKFAAETRDAVARLSRTAEEARVTCAIVDAAAKVRDLNFKYLAEGKGATVTARFLSAASALPLAGAGWQPADMIDSPSALSGWSPEQIADGKRWLAAWQRAGPDLERIRRREIRELDTFKGISQLCGPADYTRAPYAPKGSSGLVEQQWWFKKNNSP